ncbi:MAG: metallophosphoesterase family protein [Deltaproteobacteria bacterium]|nr:metallophosphoesterase family protein [Deltaproteobacteria bacterium]
MQTLYLQGASKNPLFSSAFMRQAIISDIHSNLEALVAVIERIDALEVNSIVCLGDIVGYNAQPNECVDMIRERGIPSVMGNHDARAGGLEEPDNFNPIAKRAVLWTRSRLSHENLRFLCGLPRMVRVQDRFAAVHGAIDDTDTYILGRCEIERNFKLLEGSGFLLCFFGHTHLSSVYSSDGMNLDMHTSGCVEIRQGLSYLINPGAVGQPRDGDPRASFLVYDSGKKLITFERVEYDIESASRNVIEAGLPKELASRLFIGR